MCGMELFIHSQTSAVALQNGCDYLSMLGLNSKRDPIGRFYLHGLTLIPAWISNHMPSKVWDEITYPFLNFNGCTVEV